MRPLQRTSWSTVVVFALAGFIIGYLTEVGLSATGNPPLVTPYTLPATLVTLAIVLIAFAIPLRRAVTGASKKPVNPFVAIRIVAAAKASTISGALFAGFGLGIITYFAFRTVPPQTQYWWPVVATALAGLILLAAGLIAEHLGRVPPRTPEETEEETDAGTSDGPDTVAVHRQAHEHVSNTASNLIHPRQGDTA